MNLITFEGMDFKTFVCVYWMTLVSSTFAYADLGGDLASVQKDSKALGALTALTLHPHYNRHELTKSGILVHEFQSANGKIFGIAWRGKKHPDLKTLMGSHFKDFQDALEEARRQHRHGGTIVVDSGNFHLEMGGHMMSVYGQAWLTDQVPNGMDVHEIQ